MATHFRSALTSYQYGLRPEYVDEELEVITEYGRCPTNSQGASAML